MKNKKQVKIIEHWNFRNHKEQAQWFIDNVQRLADQGLKSKAIGLRFIIYKAEEVNDK
tara:strand:+ start:2065 stop:2238 length:174 start_codon:yes stop_codon:yes gene_type:complete